MYSETSISGNTTHGKSVNGIIAWNSDDSNAIGHDDVFALANYAESRLLESLDCIEMIDARDFGHG